MTTTENLPADFPREFTFRDLNEWYVSLGKTIDYLGMTMEQEMWYRFLFRPETQLHKVVTWRGIPIIVI